MVVNGWKVAIGCNHGVFFRILNWNSSSGIVTGQYHVVDKSAFWLGQRSNRPDRRHRGGRFPAPRETRLTPTFLQQMSALIYRL
jgi:hypothetical protein